MSKIKVERAVKLNQEDMRGRNYNLLTGSTMEKKVWLNGMGE